jgi:cell division septum initiation protein DivIVA
MNEVTVLQPDDRSEIVLNALSELSKRVVNDFCEIADLLHEAWEYQYHKTRGYESFQDYTEHELDIKGRKAFFLVQIAKTVKKLNIPWEDIKEVGWRKTAAISPVLTYDNKDKWIAEAKDTPLAYLSEKVKAEKRGKESPKEAPIRITIQIDQDENTIIQSALEYAKRYEDVKSNSQAFTRICYEYAQSKEDS